MKTSLISRLSLVAVLVSLSATLATAQTRLYSQAPAAASHGYWTVETDQANRNYTLVHFYSDQHQELYQQRIANLCLTMGNGKAAGYRNARILDKALRQVNRTQAAPVLAVKFGEGSRSQRAVATR